MSNNPYILNTSKRELKLIEHAVERSEMDEDVWDVVRWLLAALGIRIGSKFVNHAIVDAKGIKGNTVTGAAQKAVRRALSISKRKMVEVVPESRKKLIVVRRDSKVSGSSKAADKVVDYLVKIGGKTA